MEEIQPRENIMTNGENLQDFFVVGQLDNFTERADVVVSNECIFSLFRYKNPFAKNAITHCI